LLESPANADAQNANVSTTLAHRTDEPHRRLNLFSIRMPYRDSGSDFAQAYLDRRIFMKVAYARWRAIAKLKKHSSGSTERWELVSRQGMERKPAVAVVFHHIGPYHHARLSAVADRLSVTGIEWSAKGYDAWGAAEAPARYHKISLFSEAADRHPRNRQRQEAFRWALEQARPDVVAVNGWNNFGSLAAANCCVRRGIPRVVMSESARQDERRIWWKEMIKQRVLRLYCAALVGGQRHVDYLVELGMPRERIFTGYDVVDNEYFGRRTAEIRNSKFEIRKKYGLPENYFLASARFIEKKNFPTLIQAYARYRLKSQTGGNATWDLVMLGDGPLRETLNAQLSTLNLNEYVYLPGFKPYDELPVYYGLANAFVHASTTEQWGLVVNEAIASGLPVIVSERCGCAPELVQDNGFTFDPTNEQELAARLLEMASLSDEQRRQLGDASYRIAANFAPERFGEGLESAVNMAMGAPHKGFGVMDRGLLMAAAKYGR
jgi:glycosyltransferase involved in cell wall biosynthesis